VVRPADTGDERRGDLISALTREGADTFRLELCARHAKGPATTEKSANPPHPGCEGFEDRRGGGFAETLCAFRRRGGLPSGVDSKLPRLCLGRGKFRKSLPGPSKMMPAGVSGLQRASAPSTPRCDHLTRGRQPRPTRPFASHPGRVGNGWAASRLLPFGRRRPSQRPRVTQWASGTRLESGASGSRVPSSTESASRKDSRPRGSSPAPPECPVAPVGGSGVLLFGSGVLRLSESLFRVVPPDS
jgi:hypothetical protein